jgi:VIT1/CCC1 family predicted Fe2+/Mn2+ transporter
VSGAGGEVRQVRRIRSEWLQAVAMGLADGILTALLLASGRLLGGTRRVDSSLAIRVAISALATSGFVFYVGRYAELRGRLIHAERQLNLTTRGRLATTRLGRAVLLEALADAAVSGTACFAGALLPLSLAAAVPSAPQLSVLVPIGMLGLMGLVLAKALGGFPAVWVAGLVLGGCGMTALGWKLDLV